MTIATVLQARLAAARVLAAAPLVIALAAPAGVRAQTAATAPAAAPPAAATDAPADYVIGPDDVLAIVFWRERDMSAEVAVRPDGKISLPLLNDVHAAGLTPLALKERLTAAAAKFLEEPNVSVVVKQINSRKVFVTGEVVRPGPYPLSGPTTVLQMIAIAGGVKEYADDKHITIMRIENGRTVGYPFNYQDVARRKNLRQNLELKPGDTIVVP